ncbi:hypothetical protein BS78_05G084800 [Paspalum vaginatum]|nr:hypothetical protein BS78_05G084800 [Paspalum vaginatum]
MSVWGIAGVGKSSMVKNWIGGHSKWFDKYGWVNASHPFNLKDLSWRLLVDLHPESLDPEHYGTQDPIKKCHELLCTHRCLIVIDGLQFTREWDLIKDALVTTGNSGSLIIVITNEKSVASNCANTVIFNVKSLEHGEAFDLFKKKVYRNVPAAVVEEKQVVDSFSREIVAKCGGIPKVIIAVADILNKLITSNKENIESLGIQCMKLRDQFMHEMKKKTALPDLFAWVQSYFRNCPDFLKPCIFYLSIFPLRHLIRRRRLVRRWVAEGYSRASKDHTAEEKAEEFMSMLIELSMIHPVEVTTSMVYFGVGMHWCQVNGFFREYIMSVSMEENLVFELKGRCKMSLERMGQHLTIQSDWDRDENVFDGSIDVSRLRSLTVFGEWRPFFVSKKMAVLRVLDLEGTSGVKDEELKKMLPLLPPLLRFLSLRGCREITRLPDSLGHLRQLQTLDVRDTSVAALPLFITKLQKMEYVRAGPTISYNANKGKVEIPPPHTPSIRPCTSSVCSPLPMASRRQPRHAFMAGGVEVPGGVGKLSALHTLGIVHISSSSADGEAVMEDLKKLTQLHKLGVCGVNQRNSQKLCSAILCHGHLQSLSVQLDESSQTGCLDVIYGLVGKLPVWTKGLVNLRKLKLQMTAILPQDEVDVLGTLPKLQTLCLWLREFQYGKLRFGSGFTELFFLEISCNSSSRDVSFHGTEAMAGLEVLKVHCCGVSQLQFSGLDGCEELTEVRLSGTFDSALKQGLQSQLAKHPMRPVLKEWDIDMKEWKTVH